MLSISNLSLTLIITGIAADNLMVAGISGKGLSPRSNKNWMLLLLLVFIIQYQVLICSEWISGIGQIVTNGNKQWFAIGCILLIGFKMLLELKMKNRVSKYLSFHTDNFLFLVFATSVSVFVIGFFMNVLNRQTDSINLIFIPLLLLFMFAGMMLGKYHYNRTLKWLNIASALLVTTGGILLIVQKII